MQGRTVWSLARRVSAFLLFMLLSAPVISAAIGVEAPEVFLHGIPATIRVTPAAGGAGAGDDAAPLVSVRDAQGRVLAEAEPAEGIAELRIVVDGGDQLPLSVTVAGDSESLSRPFLPGWVTILPPLIAIILALSVREVFTSLFAGIWIGCLLLAGYNPFEALLMTAGRFAREALGDPDHAAIIVFSLLLGGMVGVLTRMGAARAIVDAVAPLAVTPRRGQFAAWLAGIAIFFDDYANTLVVGNTMRPLTDRLRISREKLAYIVDSTAAPVAAIAFVSTWVGYEISLIGDALRIGAEQTGQAVRVAPFGVFLASIPYLIYPLLALFMVVVVVVMKRDFGPMLAAERRARSGRGLFRPGAQIALGGNDLVEAPEDVRAHWLHAVLPVAGVMVVVIGGLYLTGRAGLGVDVEPTLTNIFGEADPFTPLLWGSLVGCLLAIALAVGGRRLLLSEAIDAWVGGMRTMLMACIILVMAWSLGALTESLGTATFISSVLSDNMPVELLPVSVFAVAALISFATGTSWTTMAILFPLVIPLTLSMGSAADPSQPDAYHHLLAAVAGVMAGSLFGDHCSPISDTTVMSSMASGCDHVDHVRTQLPYAVAVALISVVIGAIPVGLGVSPWWLLALGGVLVVATVRVLGRRVEDEAA